MPDFHSQLGSARNKIGFSPWEARLQTLRAGENPYVTGKALPPDSPVFAGREAELHNILAKLRGCQSVSLLGERRIGKSSLLNQIVQALRTEKDLLVVHTTTQSWDKALKPAAFFSRLHAAMCAGLDLTEKMPRNFGFDALCEFVECHAQKYRFAVMVDEFDRLFANPHLDNNFLVNLRTLGYDARYRLAWLTAGHAPLETLCRQHQRTESSFWNIFGISYTLGLLSDFEALELMVKPCQATPGPEPAAVQRLTGNHPALLQMVLYEAWHAPGTDLSRYRRGLYPYYQALWEVRSDAEKQVLVEILAGKTPGDTFIVEELSARGLLGADGGLFCAGFAEAMRAWVPKQDFDLLAGIDAADQATKQVKRIERIYRGIRKIIRDVRADWRGKSEKEDEAP